MAIAFVRSLAGSTFANDGSAAGGSVAITWPSATSAGNWLLAGVIYPASSTVTAPTAWSGTELSASPFSSGTTCFMRVYKIANAPSQSGTQTFTFGTTQHAAAMFFAEYSGVATSFELDGTPNSNSGNSASPAGSAYTTTVANDGVISAVAQASTTNLSATFSAATGGASIRGQAGIQDIGTPAGSASLALLDELGVAAGTYTFGCTSNRSQTWIVVTLAVSTTSVGGAVLPPPARIVYPPYEPYQFEE